MAKDIPKEVIYHTENITLQALRKKMDMCTPKDIVAYLDRNVIGQEQAKKTLAVAVHNHMRRVNRTKNGEGIPKSNILMQGSTGSGKTFLLKNLAAFLDVPIAICDASTITQAGYKGKELESVLEELCYAANGNVEMAEKGIIFLDEFDKLSAGKRATPRRSGAEMGVAVQHQILKMIEGCVMDVYISEIGKVKLNTENILFICGGAFVGLKADENASNERQPIGFIADQVPQKANIQKQKLTHQDFVEYGLIPEVVGRLPVIVELSTLTENDLTNILLNSESSVIRGYKNILNEDGVELEFEEEAIMEIAHIAHSQNTGARGLNSIVEEVMADIMFDLPSDPTIHRCVITKQAVLGECAPIIEREMENS